MMGNHNRWSIELSLQFALNPCPAYFMELDRVLRREFQAAMLDGRKVLNRALRPLPGKPGLAFAMEFESQSTACCQETERR